MISFIVGGIVALPHLWSRISELEFIHRSCGVVGYRPHVLSTTMSHLVATNCAHLMIPMLSLRERLKEAVEGAFGREYDLFVEFTGLIRYTTLLNHVLMQLVKAASIGWHSDNNRPYLQQRHYAAVCYLNEYEKDFKGGIFRFQEGEPATVIPRRGTVLIYTADEMNMHCVEEVISGERCTLALWFTSNEEHNEDLKLIRLVTTSFLQLEGLGHPYAEEKECPCELSPNQNCPRPKAASSVMYSIKDFDSDASLFQNSEVLDDGTISPLEGGLEDLRIFRMMFLGCICYSASTSSNNQHDCPVELAYKGMRVPATFSSSLEALQVVEFHRWIRAFKAELSSRAGERLSEIMSKELSNAYIQIEKCPQNPITPGMEVDSNFYSRERGHGTSKEGSYEVGRAGHSLHVEREPSARMADDDIDDFLASVQQFGVYSSDLWIKLFQWIPSWTSHGILEFHE